MKKLLFFFTGIFIFSFFIGKAQSPKISVDPASLNFEVSSGDMASKKIAIHNLGGRDLEWEAGAYWSKVYFGKKDSVDWRLPENQDYVTGNVILTRANSQGLFNIAVESFFDNESPEGTFWAPLLTKDAMKEDYDSWGDAIGWCPPCVVGETLSMYSVEDDMFWDITIESWTEGAGGGNHLGGGFAYTRVNPITWIEVDMESGLTEPLYLDSLTIWVDATDVYAGEYEGQVVIESDDPETPKVIIPVNMTVTGSPKIMVDNSDIDFDTVYVGATVVSLLYITNNGTDELTIDLSTETGAFTALPEMLTVPANSTEMVEVQFTPSAIQEYEDTLHITSADLDTTVKIALFGEGVIGTEIEVNPVSFVFDTVPGYVLSDSFLVKNTGNNTLIFGFKETPTYFEKADYDDWNLPENQDRISENVWITRTDYDGIFNAKTEDFYTDGSPEGTEWAQGYVPKHSSGEFSEDFKEATNWCPPCMVGDIMTLYLTEEMEYYYVLFDSWTDGRNGGGFSYLRSQIPPWFTLSTPGGILAPGDSVYVVWTADASDAIAGAFSVNLTLQSNAVSTPEVDIEFMFNITGTPEIINQPSYDFGGVFIGETEEGTVYIENVGTDNLIISSMSFDSTVFNVGITELVLSPYEYMDIPISFSPAGNYTTIDTLRIISNDPATPEAKIVVSGTGVLPPVISVMPTSFDETFAAGTTDTVKVYIENTGDAILDWKIFGYQNMVEFTKEDSADWTLAENQDRITDNVWITRANERGLFNYAQEISYNGSSPAGTQWSGQPTIFSLPMDYTNWGNAIGWCPPCQIDETNSLHINGTDLYYDVIFTDWTEGVDEDGRGGGFSYVRFEVTPWIMPLDQTGSINPGEKDSALVMLDATMLAKGEYTGNIMVLSNDPVNRTNDVPVTITLLGAPKMTIDGESIDYDTIMVGAQLTETIGVTNDSTDVLEVTASTSLADIFVVENPNLSITAEEGMDFYITFKPANAVTYNDTLEISSNDPNNSLVRIPLVGTGRPAPSIGIDPVMISETLFPDSIAVHTVTFSNSGEGELIFEMVDGPFWASAIKYGDTLQTDESVDIDVTIDASGLGGEYIGSILVESNDPLSMMDTIMLYLNVTGIIVNNPVADILEQEGFTMMKIDVSDVFVNAQNDSVGVTAVSSNTDVVTVSWIEDTVMISEVGTGGSVITLIGRDAYGNREFADFNFRNNAWPTVENALSDLVMNEGFGAHDIDLKGVFVDTDSVELSLSAESGNTDVVTVTVAGSTLTITEVGTGTSSIVLNADDGLGGTAETDFSFTVNAIPTVDNPIADVDLNEGFGTYDIDISNVFGDTDDDVLSLSAESDNTGVITVSVAGTTLTLTETGTGNANVTVTADDGNGGQIDDKFAVDVSEVVGIQDINGASYTVELYPNPSEGMLYLRFTAKPEQRLFVKVYDITGHLVYSDLFKNVEKLIELNLTDLQAGMYYIRIFDSEEMVSSKKFTIQ